MVVLKGVPALLSPELLYALARMGHGDEIVFADVNFPTSSICRGGPEEIRADGLGIPQLLEAVLKLLPLDTYVETPAAVMELVPSDRKTGLQTPVWRSYQSILFEAGCVGLDRGHVIPGETGPSLGLRVHHPSPADGLRKRGSVPLSPAFCGARVARMANGRGAKDRASSRESEE
ncbi:fucose mutarotase isoform X5 [Ursus maritimus]|uniref:L-fucose mutarotase n=1 Tax=Ursus maritimus TaxID=29073 RepID=A0A8M1FIB2_URSMA|nr:fucose mutarotase isoform X5 [Ursus arctos]XP_040480369.1 fucose mutarotase isoform X5 [Ursus maritimus]